MVKKLLALTLCLLSLLTFGQNSRFLTSAGSGLNDEPADAIRHSSGNVITTGYYNQLASFGNTILDFSGSDDAFISSQNSDGSYLWAKQVGGPLTDRGVIVREGIDGSIYLAGYFRGTIQYDNLLLTSNSASQDVFVAKIEAETGNPLWLRGYGGSGIENLSGMAINQSEEIWITGQFNGITQFGTNTLSSTNFYNSGQPGYDIYLTKLNSSGDVISSNQFSSPDNDFVTGLDLDDSGNIYMTLQAAVNLNIGSQTLSLSNALSGVLLKLSSSVNYLYYRVFNAPFLDIRALDVKNNLVVIGGNYEGTLTCSTPDYPAISGDYENRIFGICINSDGSYRTHFEESSISNLNLNDLSINDIGKIWIGGSFNCTFNSISDDLGEGQFNNIAYKDAFVAYYSADSVNGRTYAQMLGSRGDDDIFSVFADDDRYPVVTGSFSSNIYVKHVPNCVNCGAAVGVGGANTYCDFSNYASLYYRTSIGSKDIFCTTAIDTTTNTFDIYSRSGTDCDLSVRDPYIFPDQDTLYLCNNTSLSVRDLITFLPGFNEGNSQSNSGQTYYNRQWRRNGSSIGNNNIVTANTSAQYTVRMSTGDNCRIYHDTIQVIMLENIGNPEISVEGATLYRVIDSPSGCEINIPTAYQQEITVNGQTFNPTDSLTWIYHTPNPDEVIAVNTSEVSISEAGTYSYRVESESGCSGSRCFSIWQYNIVSLGGGGEFVGSPGAGALPPDPQFSFAFDNEVSDTIQVCKNNGLDYSTLTPELVLLDEDSVYNPITSPAFAYWTISGPNVTFPIIYNFTPPDTAPRYSFYNHYNRFRVTESGWVTIKFDLLRPWQNTDTIFTLTKSFYVTLNDALNADITFTSSTTDLCPGDTTTISFTITPPIFPYSVSTNNSLGSTGENSYDFAFPGSLNVFIDYTNDSTGCSLSRIGTKQVVYKEAPTISSNPASARKCPEDSVQIFAQSGQSVNWIGPAGDTLGTNFNIHVIPPGNYYYDLIDNDGCALLSNTIEVRNIQAVIYDSIITSNMCAGESALILLAPDTNLVYEWLPPLSGSDAIKYINQPGIYSVSVALCSNRDTLTFEVAEGLQSADIEIISEQQLLCEGSTIELQANLLANSYLWEPGNTTEAQFIVNQPGWAKVTVFDSLGCVLSDSLMFTEYPSPPAPAGINVPEACPGTPVSLSVDSDFPFIWHSLPDSSVLDAGLFYEVDVDSTGQIFGGYSVNPQTGCRSAWIEDSTILLIATNIAEIPEEILYCPNDTIEFVPDIATGIQGGFWTGPNQFYLNDNNLFIPDIETAQEGTYRYTAISAPGYCTYDTADVVLNVIYLDPAQVSFTDSICDNQTINFLVQENSSYTYSWSGPPALTYQGSDWNISDSNPANTGLYFLTSRDGNCVRTDSFQVFVSAIPPQNPLISYEENICIGDTLFLFNADSANTAGANITWFGPDVLENIGENIAFIPDFQSDMIQPLGLQYGINMCLSSLTNATPTVKPYPVFAFLLSDIEFCEGDPFVIESPIEQFAYSWSTGSSSSSTTVYESETVYLTVFDEFGCRFTDSINVEAVVCNLDDTPNAFSPNADGYNDILSFKVAGGQIYKATIFNRWGKLIHEMIGGKYEWDGTDLSGERVDDGTYFYLLDVQMINGKKEQVRGTINVFR